MELKSLSYLVFAAVVILLYFAVARLKHVQKYVLLAANVVFIYLASGLKSLVMILILAGISYGFGLLIGNSIQKGLKNKARTFMWCSVIFSVAVLCYFKFFSNLIRLFKDIAVQHSLSLFALAMPIGISFFTLTMIAYAIDVYHKKHPAEKNFLDYVTFITYFPSIVEGPVNLYKKVAVQIKSQHFFDSRRVIMGMQRLLWGYVKKVVIADRIGILVTGILRDETSSGFVLFWALVLYSFQIYADFSGGIDIIMGVSEALDIKLTENFKAPLISKSVTEYWQRWHMSLGEFMEKYLYYPIVLNRRVMRFSKKIPNSYLQKVFSATLASIVVFVIVGIWHGTGWNYVLYGCYQAFFVSLAVLLGPVYKKMVKVLHIPPSSISWNIFRVLRTFTILTFGRYFIRAQSLSRAFYMLKQTIAGFKIQDVHILFDDSLTSYGLDYKNIYLMYLCIILMIVVDILHERKFHFRETLMKQDFVFRCAIYLIGIFAIIIFGIYGPEFSSTSFIYAGF